MEDKKSNELARKDKSTSRVWLFSGIALILLEILFLGIDISTKYQFGIREVIFSIIFFSTAFIAIGVWIWDKRRPEVLITLDESQESINVFCKSEWIRIRLADISYVMHHNYRKRYGIMKSGWLIFETQKGRFKVYNVKDVDYAWHDIKCLVDKAKLPSES